jgi:hypothetical protein
MVIVKVSLPLLAVKPEMVVALNSFAGFAGEQQHSSSTAD